MSGQVSRRITVLLALFYSKAFDRSAPRMGMSRSTVAVCVAFFVILINTDNGTSFAQDANRARAANDAAPRYRYWTTNWSFESINIGTLLGRLGRFGIELPVAVDGDATVKFSVSIPLNGLREPRAYRLSGRLASNRLRVEQLELSGFSTDVSYVDGQLSLANLFTAWRDLASNSSSALADGTNASSGRFEGSASFQLAPRGLMRFDLSAASVELSPLYDVIAKVNGAQWPSLIGNMSGAISASAPINRFRQLEQWNIDANLNLSSLAIEDSIPITVQTGDLALHDGRIRVPRALLGSSADRSIRMLASVEAQVVGQREFNFRVQGNDLPVQSLARLAAMDEVDWAEGQLDIDVVGDGRLGAGDLADAQWDVNGRVASPNLTLFGNRLGTLQHQFEFDPQHLSIQYHDTDRLAGAIVQQVDADYKIATDSVQFDRIDMNAFGGSVRGSAFIGRRDDSVHNLDLQWQDVSPDIDLRAWVPVKASISVVSSGAVNWRVPANAVDRPAFHQGAARLQFSELKVGDVAIGNASLDLTANKDQWTLNGEGNLFDGQFQVHTEPRLAQDQTFNDLITFVPTIVASLLANTNLPETDEPLNRSTDERGSDDFSVQLSAERLRLIKLMAIVSPTDATVWDGLITLEATIKGGYGKGALPLLTASASVQRLTHRQKQIAQRLEGAVSIQNGRVDLRRVYGSIAGGRVDASGRYGIDGRAGLLRVTASSLDTHRLQPLVMDDQTVMTTGRLSTHLTIETGASIRVRGNAELRDSGIADRPIGSVHAGVIATSGNDLRRWSLRLHSISSDFESGRLGGDVQLNSSSARPGTVDIDGQFTARQLDFNRLIGSTNDGGYAKGNLSGQLTLNGMGVRSIADLNGRFDVELDGTQARAVPGLVNSQAYLGAFSLASTQFNEGRARGSIAGGIARLDEFWLLGQRARVTADGIIQLASGRMDVTAVVSTGSFDLQNVALLAVAEQFALQSAVPVAAIVRVNQIASNRTIYLDVLGSISDPRIRLKPAETLRREASRFAIRQAASTILPTSITGGGLLSTNGDNR